MEADTWLRPELAKDFAKSDIKLIIVSHAPPRDLRLDYEQVYRLLLSRIKEYIDERASASHCYARVLFQFRNGTRVSEAVEA
ncbi:MAG: hypothetical protein ACP5TH_04225 [Fervidicoccaceae archaeon]